MSRHIRTALIVLVIAIPAVIGAAFLQEKLKQQAEDKKYSRQKPTTAKVYPPKPPPKPPLPPAIDPAEVAKIVANGHPRYSKGLKEDYSWQQIEATLQRLRDERKERPQALNDLESWYNLLAHPAFTASSDFPEHLEKMSAWRREVPDSATALVVLANIHISHAWDARGVGLAFTVTSEGWKLFHERIEIAYDLLRAAIKKGAKDGHAYALLLTVAKADGWPRRKADDTVAAGMAIDPAYTLLYSSMAEYLLPRWHGEPGDIEQFAAHVVEMVEGDDGLDAFGLIAYRIHYYERELIYYGKYDRRLLGKAAEVLARRYPHAPNLVPFAAVCTMAAQDHQAARRVQPFIRSNESERITEWSQMARSFERWCNAREIPTGESDWIWATTSSHGNLEFDSDSRYIWCGSGWALHPVVMFDLQEKEIAIRLRGPYGDIRDLALDKQKRWLAAAINNKDFSGWVLWDINDSEEPILETPLQQCHVLAMSPTQEQIAIGSSSGAQIFDLRDRQEIRKIDVEGTYSLVYSPDGEALAINNLVYNPATGEKLYKYQGNPPLAFDEQRRPLVPHSIHSNTTLHQLYRYSTDGRTHETVIEDLKAYSGAVTISPDGKLLAIAEETPNDEPKPINVWDLSTGKLKQRFGGHWGHIDGLAFSPDGKKLASFSSDGGIIKIWNLDGSVRGPQL